MFHPITHTHTHAHLFIAVPSFRAGTTQQQQYIREPSCIILAVSASNTDLANSDALQMAQLVDAEGARTIGKCGFV